MTIYQQISDYLINNPKKEPEDIVKMIMDHNAKKEFYPLVLKAVVDEKRMLARAKEEKIFNKMVDEMSIDVSDARMYSENFESSSYSTFESLMDAEFKIRGNDYIKWRDATIEDHERYIEALKVQIMGCERNVRLHQKAIEKIRKHGVTCLNEVPKKDLVLI